MDHMANMANNRPLSEDYNLVSHRLLRRKSSANMMMMRRSLNSEAMRPASQGRVTSTSSLSSVPSGSSSLNPRTRPSLRKVQSTAEFGMGLGIRGGSPMGQTVPSSSSHVGSINRALRRRLSSRELELLYDQQEDSNTTTDGSDFLFNVPMSSSKYRPRTVDTEMHAAAAAAAVAAVAATGTTATGGQLPIIDETSSRIAEGDGDSVLVSDPRRNRKASVSTTTNNDTNSGSSTPTCSRQPGLPPKSSKELEKHQREFERILHDAASAQQKKQAQLNVQKHERMRQQSEDAKVWANKILPNFHRSLIANDAEVRDMWWRGVPAALRSQVWAKQIGNDLHIDGTQFESYAKNVSNRNVRAQIEATCGKVFPQLHIFRPQTGPLHQDLTRLVCAYIGVDSGYETVGLTRELAQIAAVILLNAATTNDAFVMLCNTVHPGTLTFALLQGRDTSDALVEGNIASFVRVFRHKLPQLFDHLHMLGLAPLTYLSPMLKSRFTDLLNLDQVMRVWDVYVFEGDAFLLRTALSALDYGKHRLYGCDSSHKVLDILTKVEVNPDENQFMDHTRSILHV